MAAFDIPEMSSSPPEGCTLKVGDKVRFVNDYGVAFGPFTIQGFTLPTDEIANAAGRTVYIDSSCYWFSKKPESLEPWTADMDKDVESGLMGPHVGKIVRRMS